MCIRLPIAAALIVGLSLNSAMPGRAEPSGISWDTKIRVSSGDAVKGPWRMNRSKFLYVDDPTVAIGEQGYVGVAWADQARLDIFFQRFGIDGKPKLKKPVNVSRSPATFSWLPRMVVASGSAREVFVLWQEIIFSGGSHGGEIFFARSGDGGRTFGQPVNLSNSLAGDGKGRLTERYWDNGSLDLTMGPNGNLYAAWTEYDGRLWFRRSLDRGGTFSPPLRVAGGAGAKPARGPSLAIAAHGTVHLAWTVGENKSADIHIATSGDAGRSFGAPRIVLQSSGHSDAPKIAVDGDGTVHLVYTESGDGPFGGRRILFARSTDGAQSFEKPREISSPHSNQFESVNFPSLSLDGNGNLYVIWELFAHRKSHSRGLGVTYSSDGGLTFAPPSIIPGSMDPAHGINGSQQGLLMRKLAVNGSAAIAVVNSTFKAKQASHIWLIRGKSNLR